MNYDERDEILNALKKSHEFMTAAMIALMELEQKTSELVTILQGMSAYLLINAKDMERLGELLVDYELIQPPSGDGKDEPV